MISILQKFVILRHMFEVIQVCVHVQIWHTLRSTQLPFLETEQSTLISSVLKVQYFKVSSIENFRD